MSAGPDVAGIGFALSILFIGLVALLATAFWIWVLVDCATKEPSGSNDKIVWILIIVFVHFLGALIYYFARRPTRIAQYGS